MLPDESAIEIRDQLRQLAFDVSRVAGIGAQVFLGLPRSGRAGWALPATGLVASARPAGRTRA